MISDAIRFVKYQSEALLHQRAVGPKRANGLPILVEAKSAGDFTNTNKRRKEEAKKMSQLKDALGNNACYIVFLCGYFDAGYLGYEAQDGIDWVWEHRINDFEQLGV
ncbi:MAG: XamI family restriction endonuclease [Pirellulaceae bacterium]|nr:XamI family restriction endonuclease [Pirellulaceae bacterium]